VNRYVCDTMALILRLEKRKMPKTIKDAFTLVENTKVEIYIPTIVFAELAYLSEKGRIDTTLKEVRKYIENQPNIKESPLTLEIIEDTFTIDDIPELHDRIIAGTGKNLNASILTNDPDIQRSNHVKSIWE